MSLAEALRRNTLWVLGGDVGARALGFLFGIALARLLRPEDFGLLVTVQILTGALGFVSAHGMSDALVRARAIGPRDTGTVFAVQLAVSLALFALLQAIAAPFADFFGDARLAPLMQLAALTFLLRPFMGIPSALLQRDMRFKAISYAMLVECLATGAASVAFALLGLGAEGLVLGGLAGALVRTLLLARLAHWVPALALDGAAARTFGLFGMKLSANEILQYARIQTANALVGRTLGMGRVGLYNKADSLAEIPFELLGGAAYQTLFRALAQLRDDRAQGAALFMTAVTTVAFYVLPVYLGLVWVARPLVVLLYGEQWAPAALPLQILAVAGALRALAYLSRAAAAAHDRLGQEIRVQLVTWAILVAGVLAGLPWGLPGVALGVLPSFVYNGLALYAIAAAALGLGWMPLWQALRPVLALTLWLAAALAAAHAGLAVLGLDPTGPLYLAAMVGAGTAAYGGPFLVAPAPGLADESLRWRRLLGLAPRPVAAVATALVRPGASARGARTPPGP